ncbi:MAG: S1C family serine protease [Thermoflexales bacterium]
MDRWPRVMMMAAIGLAACTLATPPQRQWTVPVPTSTPVPAPVSLNRTVDERVLQAELQALFVALYERASSSVVHITTRTQVFDFFRGIVPNEGTGSGFFVDAAGHIVTNYHVIAGADEIEVILADEMRLPARVVGADAYTDLAVLVAEGIRPEQIRPLPIGDSTALRVGMIVAAIGNPFGLDRTMTTGVVSALGRTIEREDGGVIGEVIQTDAAINPGNSGGPLLNLQGEVVGVNTSIRSPSGGSVGIGFAVPARTLQRVVPELIAKGRYDHPWLGISAYEITDELARLLKLPVRRGLLIAQVQPGAAAERAGVRGAKQRVFTRSGAVLLVGGDILVALDDRPIATRDQMTIYLENNKRVGETVVLSLIRDYQPLTLTATLTARP